MTPELSAALAVGLEDLIERIDEQTNRQMALHGAFLMLVRRLHHDGLLDLPGLANDLQTLAGLDAHAAQRPQFEHVIATLEAMSTFGQAPGR